MKQTSEGKEKGSILETNFSLCSSLGGYDLLNSKLIDMKDDFICLIPQELILFFTVAPYIVSWINVISCFLDCKQASLYKARK